MKVCACDTGNHCLAGAATIKFSLLSFLAIALSLYFTFNKVKTGEFIVKNHKLSMDIEIN